MTALGEDYVWHCGAEAEAFIGQHFSKAPKILFIGAVGFDSRTLEVSRQIAQVANKRIDFVFIREERPQAAVPLKAAADSNFEHLESVVGAAPDVRPINIFADDGAVVGGRRVVALASSLSLAQYTDIVVDISAMSRGVFFPLVRYLREALRNSGSACRLHLFVIDHPELDYSYRPQYDDRASYMHGFDGDAQRVGRGQAVVLWLPQLVPGRREVYSRLHALVKPADVCPVIPFPGTNPRRGDELIFEYRELLSDTWETDLRNVVLAAESDPLDLYRTVYRMDSTRRRLFGKRHQTLTVLSPMGSKVSTIGGMLAAIDLNLPVAYVETACYKPHSNKQIGEKGNLVHVWIEGPVQESNRHETTDTK